MSDAPEGITMHADIPYTGTDEVRQMLDLYTPDDAPRPLPVIVLIHGGGWLAGDKGPLAGEEHFVRNGFALARINYRYSTQAVHPAQIEDCRAAVRWLRAHADDYGLNTEAFFVMGHSAGGHLASLLGCTAYKEPGTSVCAVVDQCGGADLLRLGRERKAASTPDKNKAASIEGLLGHPVDDDPERALDASPISHISKEHTPPHLLMFGEVDDVVPAAEGERFHAALQAAGVESTLMIMPGAGHVSKEIWGVENLDHALDFFRKHMP